MLATALYTHFLSSSTGSSEICLRTDASAEDVNANDKTHAHPNSLSGEVKVCRNKGLVALHAPQKEGVVDPARVSIISTPGITKRVYLIPAFTPAMSILTSLLSFGTDLSCI
ncbi:hypothetical protein K469DRAFT_2212 [Zopfia rhizophila CBS 207.26]|uniref:Uncharacterized protein n=1 Tax=Zopfia rhizophila CBS 207.26 TaxID=1314779 RepID=A0A6A6EW57_9PEZI|nr:hypothetical protein K469DRAFT_2212 [Zopfia rhizophila CBS 207.26]